MIILNFLLQAYTTNDSLQEATVSVATVATSCSAFIDIAYKLSMVAIAVFNIFYVIRLNRSQSQDKLSQRITERNIDLLKTIVLIPNMRKMYSFLDKLWQQLEKLKLEEFKEKTLEKEEEVKTSVEPEIQKLFSSFRSDFIIALHATVPSLGKKVESICDDMRDSLIGNMADPGINLWVSNCFNDKIKSVYEKGKKEIVSTLFSYEGND